MYIPVTDKTCVPEHPAGKHHNYSNVEIISKHQTNYEYDANHFFVSENYIQPRLLYKDGGSLLAKCFLPCIVLDGFIPKNSFAVKHFFGNIGSLKGYSGFFVECEASSNEGINAFLRITFFENDGEDNYNVDAETSVRTFMSSAKIHEGYNKLYFDTSKLEFPDNIGEIKVELVSVVLSTRLTLNLLSINRDYALDMRIKFRGQEPFYTTNANISFLEKQGLKLGFDNGFNFKSPDFPDNHDTVCNMLMPLRNTVFMVLENKSSVSELTVKLTSHENNLTFEKKFPIEQNSKKKAYYFNFSDVKGLTGRLKSFELVATAGNGELIIYSYSFEQEKIIEETCGKSVSCIADNETVTIKGELKEGAKAGDRAVLYRTLMADGEDRPQGKTLLTQIELKDGATSFTLTTPMKHGKITELTSQFIIFIKNGDSWKKFTDRFYIQNANSFVNNKYYFELPNKDYNVLDYGAKGDAFSDDTKAIQDAIDECSKNGGGRVVLPGCTCFYQKRYIFTNILLRSNVDLHIEEGAVLWQDQDPDDYTSIVAYGHDGYIEGVNWTHCLHVCNLPHIHCHNSHNVKITGKGKIRSMDTGSEEGVGMPGYSCGCPDRIHQIVFGFFNVSNINIEDVEIVRSNNYHMSLYHCDHFSIIGIKMHEVKCVSGDGVGCGSGAHDILLANIFFQSNDDAVTISSSYNDPREILWWHGYGNGVCATRNIEICHCYLNSGGGKAIGFIPWGTVQTYQELATIKNVLVYDNYLTCVNPVGAWADDPFKGRFPFDNVEPNDYAPVQEVRIFDNVYDGNCTVYPLEITDFVTDCGIDSPSNFLNQDFSLGGFGNYQLDGKVKHYFDLATGKEGANVINGSIYQGLFLPKGKYTFKVECFEGSKLTLFAKKTPFELGVNINDCDTVSSVDVSGNGTFISSFEIESTGNYYVGVKGENVKVKSFDLSSQIDKEAIKKEKIDNFFEELGKTFEITSEMTPHYVEADGKVYLNLRPASGDKAEFSSKKKYVALDIYSMIERNDILNENEGYQYGFDVVSEKATYRFMVYSNTQRLLLLKIADDKVNVLYEKTNFFFTSSDFHSFELIRTATGEITIFVDNSMYASVETADDTEAVVKVFTVNTLNRFNKLSIN